jgi:hypothetical protein
LLGKVQVIVNWQNGVVKDCNVYYLRGWEYEKLY